MMAWAECSDICCLERALNAGDLAHRVLFVAALLGHTRGEGAQGIAGAIRSWALLLLVLSTRNVKNVEVM